MSERKGRWREKIHEQIGRAAVRACWQLAEKKKKEIVES